MNERPDQGPEPLRFVRAVELLDACTPHFPQGLIAAQALAAIRAMAERLPGVSGMGLELHLGATTPRTDFLWRLTQRELRANPALRAAPLFAQPRWMPVARLLSAWAELAPGALDSMENLWLEFDVGTSYTLESMPSLFCDLDRDDRLSDAQKLMVMSTLFETLAVTVPHPIKDQLRRCVEQARPTLLLYYIGLMLGRGGEAVRVCLSGRHAAALRPYLERVSFGGDVERIEALLARYAARSDKVILDIDVATRLHDAIGIELFASPACPWEELLGLLVADGLGSAKECAAILGFAGSAAEAGGRLLIRRVNHLKLCVGADGTLRAKAYLYLCYG